MPAVLGRYEVRRRIGAGGFATVWLAHDAQLDGPVAVKVLAENWSENHHIRQRFLEEGRFLRRVDSPHVVAGHDAGELEDGRPYLVMSYADRGNLADRLERGGMTPEQALEVVAQVGAGLQALHDRGIVHRDVKPANVLFRSVHGVEVADEPEPFDLTEVRAMVGDLGLGRALDASSRLTMAAGTPAYVAPEQARAETPDARADQYSLAALTFTLLTGRPPYDLGSLGAAANPGPPPPLSTAGRPFPPAVETVVHRGLARDRDDRFPSVAEYVAALRAAFAGEAIPRTTPTREPDTPQPVTFAATDVAPPPRHTPARSRRSRRGRLAVAGAGMAVLGGGALGLAAWDGPDAASTIGGVTDVRCWDGSTASDVGECREPDTSTEAAAWVFGIDDVERCSVAGHRADEGRLRSWWCTSEVGDERVEFHYSVWESNAAARAVYDARTDVEVSTVRTGWQQWLMPAQGGRAKAALVYAEAPWGVTVYADDAETRDLALQDLLRRMRAEQDLAGMRIG